MKTILLILFFTNSALASQVENLKVIGRLHHNPGGLTLIRGLDGKQIPSVLRDQSLKKSLSSLLPGDDVIVEGDISYVSSTVEIEPQMRPIFVITSIKPISLSRLGDGPEIKLDERLPDLTIRKSYSPLTIPVSTEVASAVTLTTSLLLMQSLTASPTDPGTRQQLNSGLILFAGAMATGIFIFEQIFEVKNNK